MISFTAAESSEPRESSNGEVIGVAVGIALACAPEAISDNETDPIIRADRDMMDLPFIPSLIH